MLNSIKIVDKQDIPEKIAEAYPSSYNKAGLPNHGHVYKNLPYIPKNVHSCSFSAHLNKSTK